MGDLFMIALGIIICILFKKYDDGLKAKLKKAEGAAEKVQKKEKKDKEVDALRAQVAELTRIVKESTKKSPTE